MKKETKQEEIKEPLLPREERLRLEYFRKLVNPTITEMDEIFMFYNKYVGKAPHYLTNCDCNNSIQSLYWALMGWYSGNQHKFEI